jgi:DNA-binding NarL/FixJ family response regulator
MLDLRTMAGMRTTTRCYSLLTAYQDVEVVGEAANGEEAISAVERLQPYVVVMDIRMPAFDGVAAACVIRENYRHMKIIGLSEDGQSYNIDGVGRSLSGN